MQQRLGLAQALVGSPRLLPAGIRRFPRAGREDAPGIVADLVAAGERVYGVKILATNLEDVYLQAVSESAPAA
jgi:hypothetical protein